MRDPDSLGYARVVAPGLLEVLSVDLPDSVAMPTREELAERGTIGNLLERGRENLHALLRDPSLVAETVGRASAAGSSRSPAARSSPPASPSCLRRDGRALHHMNDWGRGFLVAVPNRHQLLWRPVDRADASVALDRMIEAALRGFAAGGGRSARTSTGCGPHLGPGVLRERQGACCAHGAPRTAEEPVAARLREAPVDPVAPFDSRSAFAFEKCRQPKKPLTLYGDGCRAVST